MFDYSTSTMESNTSVKFHVVEDSLFVSTEVLKPLCGTNSFLYINTIKLSMAKHYKEEQLCPDCISHPDYPLLVLKHLDDNEVSRFDWKVNTSKFYGTIPVDIKYVQTVADINYSGTTTGRLPPSYYKTIRYNK